jgi:cell wall-associated NlpC family hydrolase
MGHKILFLCAFVPAALFPASAGASSAEQAAVQAPQALAYDWVGTRYRYGGKSPETGFDCSGLVAHVFERSRGIRLPANAEAQSKVGIPVKRVALEPGDLVFYNTRNRPNSHVGIYLGEGQFVHAPRPGQRVRVESIHSSYWRARFNGARRVEHPGA